MSIGQVHHIRRAADFIAQMIAGYRVRIEFNGSQTATDGKTISIGPIALDTPWYLDVLMGFVAHEALHCQYTEFRRSRRDAGAFVFSLWNSLEDARIERLGIRLLPGLPMRLDACVRWSVDRGNFPELVNASPAFQFSGYLLYVLRDQWLNQPLVGDMAERAKPMLTGHLGEAGFAEFDALCRADLPSTTEGCFKRAKAIAELLQRLLEQPPKNNEQPDPSDAPEDGDDQPESSDGESQPSSGEGEAGDGEDDASGDAAGKPSGGESEEGEGKKQNDNKGDAKGEQGDGESSGKPQAGAGQSPARPTPADLNQAGSDDVIADLGQAMQEALNAVSQASDQVVSGEAVNRRVELVDAPLRTNSRLDDSAAMAMNQLRTLLRTRLMAEQRERRLPARSGKRFMGNRVQRVLMGQGDVFRQDTRKSALNTVVGVLVDASSSMVHQQRHLLASTSAEALCGAMDGLRGVATTAAAYCGNDDTTRIRVWKREGEPFTASQNRFMPWAAQYTPTGEAAQWMIEQLASSRKARKILLLLTDGEANGQLPVETAFELAAAAGIEVHCIGIEQHLRAVYPNRTTISSATDLPKVLFNTVSHALDIAA